MNGDSEEGYPGSVTVVVVKDQEIATARPNSGAASRRSTAGPVPAMSLVERSR